MRTSVVIATHQRCSRLEQLIGALLAEPETYEVVVVIDGSQDGSTELLNRLALQDARVVSEYQANLGEAAARAAGVRRAGGEIVLLLDDDVTPEPGLVAGHQAHHEACERLLVVGYMPVASTQTGRHKVGTRMYSAAYESTCHIWDGDPGAILNTLWAGNISVRRDDALRIGLEGTRRLDFHADRDFGLRCQAAGMHAIFDRSLRARHEYERTLSGLVRDAHNQGRALVILHREHPQALGPMPRHRFTALLPRPLGVLVQFCRRPRAGALVVRALTILVWLAGVFHLYETQEDIAILLVQVGRQRGAISAR